MHLFNQFSYPLFVIVFGVMLFIGLSRLEAVSVPISIGVMVAYVIGAFFVGTQFQYPDSPVEAETIADVKNTLTNNRATFLMLYSNY